MNISSQKSFAVALICASLLSACSFAPKKPEQIESDDYSYLREYGEWLINQQMKQHKVVGLSVAIVDGNKTIWNEGFGYADKEKEIQANEYTLYRAGSVSKLFTATAVMQLVEEGKLDLDAPLTTYLPEFSMRSRFENSKPITLRHLLSHQSGLPTNYLKGMTSTQPQPIRTVLAPLADEHVATPPEYAFSYSNLGITLAGLVVEKVTGTTFESYMEQQLLTPLRMNSAYFSSQPKEGAPLSQAYKKGEKETHTPLRDTPAGGLYASANDIANFIKMILANGRTNNQQIIQTESLAEMLTPQNQNVPLDGTFKVGLGWMLSGAGEIDIQGAGTVAHHSGQTTHFNTQLITLPEQDLGIIVMANSTESRAAVDHIATQLLKLALEIKTGIKQPKPQKPKINKDINKEALEKYVGHYTTNEGLIEIKQKNDYLTAKFQGAEFKLHGTDKDQLALQYRLWGLFPISLGAMDYYTFSLESITGHEVLYLYSGDTKLTIAEKVPALSISDSWQQIAGTYHITNLGNDLIPISGVEISYEKGLLKASYIPLLETTRQAVEVVISPISESEAVIFGLGEEMGETARIEQGKNKTRIFYSGYVFEKSN